MQLYSKNQFWQISLIIYGIVIVIITLAYANYLANQLKIVDKEHEKIYEKALAELGNPKNSNELGNDDVGINLDIIETFNRPVILEDETGKFEYTNIADTSQHFSQSELQEMVKDLQLIDQSPIKGWGYHQSIYILERPLFKIIKLFPIVQFLLLLAFVVFGYLLFDASRRSEQNRVWAGMAKETAHQLGTPISAVLAWIEHLRDAAHDNDEILGIVHEMENDVTRLNLVADRFSKIGSEPALDKVNIYDELHYISIYMAKRSPRKMVFDFPAPQSHDAVYVNINNHLFSWVLENVIRNALDSMGPEGLIKAIVLKEPNYICIEISDSGKGIPHNKFKSIFKPGFSTKTRGWGLGLSLAKRIVEEYHRGKIFVKESTINKGTTFSIKLPKII